MRVKDSRGKRITCWSNVMSEKKFAKGRERMKEKRVKDERSKTYRKRNRGW